MGVWHGNGEAALSLKQALSPIALSGLDQEPRALARAVQDSQVCVCHWGVGGQDGRGPLDTVFCTMTGGRPGPLPGWRPNAARLPVPTACQRRGRLIHTVAVQARLALEHDQVTQAPLVLLNKLLPTLF